MVKAWSMNGGYDAVVQPHTTRHMDHHKAMTMTTMDTIKGNEGMALTTNKAMTP